MIGEDFLRMIGSFVIIIYLKNMYLHVYQYACDVHRNLNQRVESGGIINHFYEYKFRYRTAPYLFTGVTNYRIGGIHWPYWFDES